MSSRCVNSLNDCSICLVVVPTTNASVAVRERQRMQRSPSAGAQDGTRASAAREINSWGSIRFSSMDAHLNQQPESCISS
jgi:hypothetical protein